MTESLRATVEYRIHPQTFKPYVSVYIPPAYSLNYINDQTHPGRMADEILASIERQLKRHLRDDIRKALEQANALQ